MKHFPTEETRAQIEALAAHGIKHSVIAKYERIGVETLRKYYRDELARGIVDKTLAVVDALYAHAISGKPGSQQAAIFWLKTHAGWGEDFKQDDTVSDGRPAEMHLDYSLLTDDELREITRLSAKVRVRPLDVEHKPEELN